MSDRLRRWRMVLGGDEADGLEVPLSPEDLVRDTLLEKLYDADRTGGLGRSSPYVARWLADIRTYFPTSVVQVLQRDALERLDLKRMLLEPELLEVVHADVHLVASLMALNQVMPARTRATATAVVRKVVDELLARLRTPTVAAVRGSLNRATRSLRPRSGEIDWDRTIRANLRNYRPEGLIVDRLVGYGRRRSRLRDVVLCVDQSGSMAGSVVYAAVFGAVLASLPTLRTRMAVFDTQVADLTAELRDPVDLLFGVQLGGGTDIDGALSWAEGVIERPRDTILVLVSDLEEGGDSAPMLARAAHIRQLGVTVIALLALSDEGAPAYHADNAAKLAAMGIPAFACTPDRFPDLMSAAIERRDLAQWASVNDVVTAR